MREGVTEVSREHQEELEQGRGSQVLKGLI